MWDVKSCEWAIYPWWRCSSPFSRIAGSRLSRLTHGRPLIDGRSAADPPFVTEPSALVVDCAVGWFLRRPETKLPSLSPCCIRSYSTIVFYHEVFLEFPLCSSCRFIGASLYGLARYQCRDSGTFCWCWHYFSWHHRSADWCWWIDGLSH